MGGLDYVQVFAEPEAVHRTLREAQDPAVTRYVRELNASYGRHARPAREARLIVDESMGAAGTLTKLPYESREAGAV